MPFQECMERVSHRWYRTWERWSQDEWNKPSRSDNYLMQIAQRIQQFHASWQKPPRQITMDMQKIPFEFKSAEPAGSDKPSKSKLKAAAAASKGAWCRAVGVGK